jgi:hypothetical protein
MHVLGAELLHANHESLKFILNDAGIIFFPATQEHRDVKTVELSYEDDYRGNAVAGLLLPGRVEIRFHRAFSPEHIRNLWSRVLTNASIAREHLGQLYYQGKELTGPAPESGCD